MTLRNLNLRRTARRAPLTKENISHICVSTDSCLESTGDSSSKEKEHSAGREQHSVWSSGRGLQEKVGCTCSSRDQGSWSGILKGTGNMYRSRICSFRVNAHTIDEIVSMSIEGTVFVITVSYLDIFNHLSHRISHFFPLPFQISKVGQHLSGTVHEGFRCFLSLTCNAHNVERNS